MMSWIQSQAFLWNEHYIDNGENRKPSFASNSQSVFCPLLKFPKPDAPNARTVRERLNQFFLLDIHFEQ